MHAKKETPSNHVLLLTSVSAKPILKNAVDGLPCKLSDIGSVCDVIQSQEIDYISSGKVHLRK